MTRKTFATFSFLIIFLSENSFAATSCEQTQSAVIDIKSTAVYSDKSSSIIDPARKADMELKTKPIRDYLRSINNFSDIFIANGDISAGKCALKWINEWAAQGALLGEAENPQAEYMRKWSLSGIALSYLKVKSLAEEDVRKNIEPWLSSLADKVLAYSNSVSARPISHNNHLYYVGVAAMASGIATGRQDLINRASDIYNEALSSIETDGSLPLEMARKEKALQYHSFSLSPLIIMAELSRSFGENWYGRQNGKINKLANLVLSGTEDSKWFEEKAGVLQYKPQGGDLGWVEFYLSIATDSQKIKPLLKLRPFKNLYLGGNLTLLAKKDFFGSLQFSQN